MRTFAPSDWHATQAAWDDGHFSREWRDVRHTMAMQGCIYPPAGTEWDSWEDDQPTQRAILIRAIREQPKLLRKAMKGAHTWSTVIERLMKARDDWREDLDDRQREADRDDAERRASHRESAMALSSILKRIGDS